jgi:hypothetical protein
LGLTATGAEAGAGVAFSSAAGACIALGVAGFSFFSETVSAISSTFFTDLISFLKKFIFLSPLI